MLNSLKVRGARMLAETWARSLAEGGPAEALTFSAAFSLAKEGARGF